jgi:hypothetical protein
MLQTCGLALRAKQHIVPALRGAFLAILRSLGVVPHHPDPCSSPTALPEADSSAEKSGKILICINTFAADFAAPKKGTNMRKSNKRSLIEILATIINVGRAIWTLIIWIIDWFE